jgi:alpha-galactosidase
MHRTLFNRQSVKELRGRLATGQGKCKSGAAVGVAFLISFVATAQQVKPGYTDIAILANPRPMVRITSGKLVYEEQLYEGGLRTKFWSPEGLIKPDAFLEAPGRLNGERPSLDEPIADAFGLSVDGQELWDGWQWHGTQEVPCAGKGCREVIEDLSSSIRPIRVKVHTQIDGSPFLRRWLEIASEGSTPTAIGSVFPMSGYLFSAHGLKENLGENAPFSVLRPASFEPGREGDLRWRNLPDGSYSHGSSKYGMPFAIINNAVTGESFVLHFAWSGNYSFQLFNTHDPARDDAELYFRVGLSGPGPLRLLSPGESVSTPSVYIGHFLSDLDTEVQALHRYERSAILPPLPQGRLRPVEANSWGFVRDEISEESLKAVIDTSAEVGVELFTIDAGWFGDVGSKWLEVVGDWKVGSRLPHGLEPIFDYARKKGLLCGLWVDIERIGLDSELRKKHPDWVIQVHGVSGDRTALDFTKPQVVKFAEDTITSLIERYKLDVFRLDYNTDIGRAGAQDNQMGFEENTSWRHYQALYAMYERLRRRFPNLMLENCASGGGRNDLGMLRNFHWAQVSDEWGGVRTLKPLNGFSIVFPPEYGMSYVGFMGPDNYRYGDVDFRFRGQMFGQLCLGGIVPDLLHFPDEYRDRVRHNVMLYKSFIRPILPTALVYHHTPILPNTEPGSWAVIEHAAPDHSKAYAGIFRLAGAKEDTYLFKPRGLDPSKTYKVIFDNTNVSVHMKGIDLVNQGLSIRIGQSLRSELLLFEAES